MPQVKELPGAGLNVILPHAMAKSIKYWRSACLAENATPANHYRASNKKGVRELLTGNGYKPCKEGFTNGTFTFGKPKLVEASGDNVLDILIKAFTGQLEEKELKSADDAENTPETPAPAAA